MSRNEISLDVVTLISECLQIISLFSTLSVRDHISYAYKTTDKIIILYICKGETTDSEPNLIKVILNLFCT